MPQFLDLGFSLQRRRFSDSFRIEEMNIGMKIERERNENRDFLRENCDFFLGGWRIMKNLSKTQTVFLI